MLWPRKTSTRCSAQACLIARTVGSDSSLVRSTPLICAPQADDSGVTSMSRMSCCRANIDSAGPFSPPAWGGASAPATNWGWELPSLGQGPINSQAASAARLSDIIDAIVGMSIQPRAGDPTQNLERRVDQAVDSPVTDASAITILQDPDTVQPCHGIE